MEIRQRFLRDMLSLTVIPFLSFSQKNVILTFITFCAFQLLSVLMVKYPRKIHELIKLPETLSIALGMMQWFFLIEIPYVFAICLMILYFQLLMRRELERKVQSERLGPRFSHYDYWVTDFLPSWIPASRLPAGRWQESGNLISRLKESHNILSLVLVIICGLIQLKPGLSNTFHALFGFFGVMWFIMAYRQFFKIIWTRRLI